MSEITKRSDTKSMSVKLRNSIVCKEKVEWTQGQRWEDKTLKGNILTIHALFGIQLKRKEMLPRKLQGAIR